MRCLDSGGTHLWPLSLKQPHTALTARTCYCAGKDYGLAKGSFLISVFCGNEKLWFTTYQHHNIHLNHDIRAAILPSCMYHAGKPLRQLIQLKRYKSLWLQVYAVSLVLVIYYSLQWLIKNKKTKSKKTQPNKKPLQTKEKPQQKQTQRTMTKNPYKIPPKTIKTSIKPN